MFERSWVYRDAESVNAGLRRTIQKEPTRFIAYNNGIVATADQIDIDQHHNGILTIRALRGLQIVNGGQTTVSLHRARKRDKVPINSIAVPAKIILVKHGGFDSMVLAVSRYANSQNTIQPAEFSANDPFHVAIESLANSTWLPNHSGRWFYERARGSYGAAELGASFRREEKRRFADETPKSRRFSKTDLAKYLNSWNGLPYSVSCGNQKNFRSFMHSMKEKYPEGFFPDETWYKAFIGKAILFRTVQAIVKARKFPAYQANITTYTVACISWKSGGNIDFDLIWSHQALSPQMQAMINDWVAKIDQNSAAPPVPGCQANGQRRCNAGKQCAMLRSTCRNLVRPRLQVPQGHAFCSLGTAEKQFVEEMRTAFKSLRKMT